jgi:hypothetical protein
MAGLVRTYLFKDRDIQARFAETHSFVGNEISARLARIWHRLLFFSSFSFFFPIEDSTSSNSKPEKSSSLPMPTEYGIGGSVAGVYFAATFRDDKDDEAMIGF